MAMTVVCQSCGARRTLPHELYEARVRGRVVSIACKACGATIIVDGTIPPPAGSDPELVDGPIIPKHAAFPIPLDAPYTPSELAKASAAGDPLTQHAQGPISQRGPSARIGRYALFEQFAVGGMATVHFGRLDGAGGFSRLVAIKRLLPHLLANREFTDMLLNEARLAARVRHPNVVATLDVVASKGDVLLVLDYVEGEALSTLCRAQAKERKEFVPIPIAVGIVRDLLHGLLAIHEAVDEKGRPLDLVHRDVSPPNVLVGVDGVARVLDFGIAKALQHLDESMTGRRMGKMGYMSPEQIQGQALTQRSDVFSAGIVFWELLAMRRMFPADRPEERIDSVLAGNYPKPSSLRPDLPAALDDVVMRSLELSPDARFATIAEFSEALELAARPASRREIGDWVTDLARDALGERKLMVARLENWADSPLIPLSSSPFASEIPEPRPTPLAPPNEPKSPASSPLESPRSSQTAMPAKAAGSEASRSSSGIWILLAILIAGLVCYVAHR